jgi:hypothetical protein
LNFICLKISANWWLTAATFSVLGSSKVSAAPG